MTCDHPMRSSCHCIQTAQHENSREKGKSKFFPLYSSFEPFPRHGGFCPIPRTSGKVDQVTSYLLKLPADGSMFPQLLLACYYNSVNMGLLYQSHLCQPGFLCQSLVSQRNLPVKRGSFNHVKLIFYSTSKRRTTPEHRQSTSTAIGKRVLQRS